MTMNFIFTAILQIRNNSMGPCQDYLHHLQHPCFRNTLSSLHTANIQLVAAIQIKVLTFTKSFRSANCIIWWRRKVAWQLNRM